MRFLARLKGRSAQGDIASVVGSFDKMAKTLEKAHENLGVELRANAEQQAMLEVRNEEIRMQRNRAMRVHAKLAEFLA